MVSYVLGLLPLQAEPLEELQEFGVEPRLDRAVGPRCDMLTEVL